MLVDLFSSVLAHYFDGSVLTWSTGPPHLITFDPENARWVQELDHDVDGAAIRKLGFAGLLFLTRAALKRWCEHNGFVLPPEWISADPDLSIGLTDQPDQEHGAAITLVAQDEKTEPQRRARGPKKGSGKYAHPDRGLFPVIKKMHDSGMPLYGAVSEISDRISGNSQRESLIRRVERRYRQEVLGKK
jgi:hypothetical protein